MKKILGFLVLLSCSLPVFASLVVQVKPPPDELEDEVVSDAATVSEGKGTVTSATSSTVRIDNNLYTYSADNVKVKAATYPYREMKLDRGMKVKFKYAVDKGGGLRRLLEATVE